MKVLVNYTKNALCRKCDKKIKYKEKCFDRSVGYKYHIACLDRFMGLILGYDEEKIAEANRLLKEAGF